MATTWSQWYKINDKALRCGFSIRRYRTVNGKTKWERVPAHKYKKLSADEVDTLIRQMNATHEVKMREHVERFNFDHAYVNARSIAKFGEYLSSRINDQNHITSTLSFLSDYVFSFFINEKKIPDPSLWHTASVEWGEWLLKKKLNPTTVIKIVNTANRFTSFLQEYVYTDMPSVRKLSPIGRNKIRLLKAKAKAQPRFMDDESWNKCLEWFKINDPSVLPNVLLCEAYGLRLSESQGLDKSKFYKEYVIIDEQGDRIKFGKFVKRKTKTIDARKVPHWNVDPKTAWEWVKDIKPIHPDTLNRRVNAGLHALGFTSHDMRRRFVTKALRKYQPRDVQAACGHRNIMTTMGYAQDDRHLSDELADLD
jgi:integrase